ncbi:carbohydrate kinase [Mesorhizobium sp. L-8-10]|uniref:carbohydrate kinase n=1 Tax=Mesorhizobium sp. L-8-10 TaxID=2744523 RepID=UPI001927DF17|nr:carbohydrate kinase [Mesorhizobium sp. L-8-10]BCH30882.1 carbohydrate kinase [Mesorhizobium sp. L-8-10]
MNNHQLGQQERAVLAAIAANPFISQSEIAAALGLARSTVAAHIVSLGNKGYILGRGYVLPDAKRILCLGGAVVDRKYHAARAVMLETSNPVSSQRSFGGVARNVCENLTRLGVSTGLASIVGDDDAGRALVSHMRNLGCDTTAVVAQQDGSTAEYVAVVAPDSSLVVGLADMGIFDNLTGAFLDGVWSSLASSSWVFADCNATAELLEQLVTRKRSARFRLAIDAVSAPKVHRLPADLSGLDLLFLNMDEAAEYLADTSLAPEAAAVALRARGPESVVITRGSKGALIATADGVRHCPSIETHPVDVTGAGDALIAGTLYSLLSGEDLFEAVRTGCLLAARTTESHLSVHHELSPDFLERSRSRLASGADHAP